MQYIPVVKNNLEIRYMLKFYKQTALNYNIG